MFPEVKKEQIIEKSEANRNFKKGERVAVREYINKNGKWRFGNVVKKLGKLHYEIKLDDGKIWKRHVEQMKGIGNHCIISTKSDRNHNGSIM